MPRLPSLLLVLTVVGVSGCDFVIDCRSNDDCPLGYHCLRSTVGWVESSICAPRENYEEVLMEEGCLYICEDRSLIGARCIEDGRTVCGADCTGTGYGDCDGDFSNACETDFANDAANCGACQNSCQSVFDAGGLNATGLCAGSVCVATACAAGFQDLDGDVANGCPVSFDSTVSTLEGTAPGLQALHAGVADTVLTVGFDQTNSVLVERFAPADSLLADGQISLPTTSPNIRASAAEVGSEVWVVVGSGAGFSATTDNGTVQADALPGGIVSGGRSTPLMTTQMSLFDSREADVLIVDDDSNMRWFALSSAPLEPNFGCVGTADGGSLCELASSTLAGVGVDPAMVLASVDDTFVLSSTAAVGDLVHHRLSPGDSSTTPLMTVAPDGPLGTVIDLEAWVTQSGEPRGLVAVVETGDVHFLELTVQAGTLLIERIRTVGMGIVGVRDLVALSGDRYLVIATSGLYVVSGREDEPEPAQIDDAIFTRGLEHEGRLFLVDDENNLHSYDSLIVD